MKKSVIITAAFAALLFIAACERETISTPQDSGDGIRITFSCGDINTKSQPGVGNENLIKTVDVFLFNGSDPEHNPEFKHHWRFSPEIESYFTCFIQAAVIANDSYNVFSIVNYPGPETDFVISGTEATLDQLKALALSESSYRTFTAAGASGITPAANADLALVMTGMAENITVSTVSGQTLVGNAEIELKRIPAKVTMDFYLKDEVVSTKGNVTETWTPLTEGSNIRLYLCSAAETAFVGGRDSVALSIFDYDPNLDNTTIPGKTDYSTAFSSAAFYTYPETWSYGASNEPYLKLIVPWKLVRSTAGMVQESQKEFYYKVMLPTNKFESNNWYHLILDVTQLGGNVDDEAVNVPCGYHVFDWKTGSDITSTMSPGYYLDVNVPDPQDIRFYGDVLDIPFFASGAVIIKSKTMEYEDYVNGSTVTDTDPSQVAQATEGDYVHIANTLHYDFSSTAYDVSPFKYTIVLALVGDTDGHYDKLLKVIQYPPLYIESTNTKNTTNSQPNVWVNYTSQTSTSSSKRVWDNSGTSTTGTIGNTHYSHYLGTVAANTSAVPESPNANNQNPNIYSVAATILKFSPEIYGGVTIETVLGDPRAAATNEYSTVLTGGGTGLSNYRPTAENTQNVISPKFISASSYGKSVAVSYEGARKRCAAYQESGYPAGRWRLPTQAEILFLQKLSKDSKIPSLFSPSTTVGYWAAGQLLYVLGSSNQDRFVDLSGATNSSDGDDIRTVKDGTTYRGGVRCVYDTWYWGDKPVSGNGWLGFQTSL